MRFPPIKLYSNIQLTPSFLGEGIHVDDVAYYISPSAEYAIKKGAVIAKNVIEPSHHFRMFPSVELTLDNGDVVNAQDTFSTKEAALDYLISNLETRIKNDRNTLLTLQNKIDYEERMLQLLRKKEQGWLIHLRRQPFPDRDGLDGDAVFLYLPIGIPCYNNPSI